MLWDHFGRNAELTRAEWSARVLPARFAATWSSPSELPGAIQRTLLEGFPEECLSAARQLFWLAPKARASIDLLIGTLLECGKFREALGALECARQLHGEDGPMLASLARARYGIGEMARTEQTLRRALKLDPNLEDALIWLAELRRAAVDQTSEKAGAEAYRETLELIADFPGSWCAPLWLARIALECADLGQAQQYYELVFARIDPVPVEALMQISGDLGRHGHFRTALDLCLPRFIVRAHGFQVGNNLIKACVDLRQTAAARQIIDLLFAEHRPDWRTPLLAWERIVDQLEEVTRSAAPLRPQDVDFHSKAGPIWGTFETRFAELFPAPDLPALRIGFLCGTACVERPASAGPLPWPAYLAPFTRGFPLYLAEHLRLATGAQTDCFFAWARTGGFVSSERPWTAQQVTALQHRPDYTVQLHFRANQAPWVVEISLWRGADQFLQIAWEQELDLQNSASGLDEIATRLHLELQRFTGITAVAMPRHLRTPANLLPAYCAALEQMLTLSCAQLSADERPVLLGERAILENLFDFTLREPQFVRARLLFIAALLHEAENRPDIAEEYVARAEHLQREFPLPEPAQGLISAALARAFPGAMIRA